MKCNSSRPISSFNLKKRKLQESRAFFSPFETLAQVTQAGLELLIVLPDFPSAGITDVLHPPLLVKKGGSWRDVFTFFYMAVMATGWKKNKWPLIQHMGIWQLALQRKEIPTHGWTLGTVCWVKEAGDKDKPVTTLTRGTHNSCSHRDREQSGGGMEGGAGGLGVEFQLCNMKRILEVKMVTLMLYILPSFLKVPSNKSIHHKIHAT